MKKIVSYLLMFVLIIPFVVKADMGAPSVRTYDVLVVKEDGIDYYDSTFKKQGKFDKDQTLTVEFELTEKDVTYLSVRTSNGGYDTKYVKASDVVVKEDEVKPTATGVDKLDKAVKVKIDAAEVIVRKGPSAAYGEIGKVKKGDTGTYKYYVDNSTYVYYESDSISGWVDSTDGAVLFKKGNYVVYKPLKLSCGTVPVGTMLTNIYITNVWTGKGLVEYNGCSEMVRVFRGDYLSSISYKSLYKFDTDVKVYADTDKSKKEIATIPKNTEVTVYGTYPEGMTDIYSYYVEYNGVKGWIIDLGADHSDFVKSLGEVEYPDTEATEETKKDEENKKDEKKENTESSGLDTMTIILICVIAGLTIALTATITIILVNKKK